jgi:hypothetical protein
MSAKPYEAVFLLKPKRQRNGKDSVKRRYQNISKNQDKKLPWMGKDQKTRKHMALLLLQQ